MKYILTITARMKSQRLPLKAMRYICGKPMIEHQIDRLKLAKKPEKIVLCTSVAKEDDILIDVAEKKGVEWFRGSKKDVLLRLFDAARKYNADFILSVTADNPLVDEKYIDKMAKTFEETNADFISCMSLPLGAYPFGMKVSALEKVIYSKKEEDTECWAKFFEKNTHFKTRKMVVEDHKNHPELRLTVDYPEDLDLMRTIFNNFYKGKNDFDIGDVVDFLLKNDNIRSINSDVKRAEHQVVVK